MKYTARAATFSKGSEFWGVDFYPNKIIRGKGAYVYDDKNRQYIDFVGGLGANLLGHNDPGFTEQIRMGLENGIAFSLPSHMEERVAEKIVHRIGERVFGHTDLQVRFGATGSDVCEAAATLSRAISGHDVIASFGYHGWHAMYTAGSPPAWGIPACAHWDIKSFEFNRIETLEKLEHLGCVILEQPVQEPSPDWYEQLRRFCTKRGVPLVMDEVVTGLRWGLGGASEKYNVRPDILVLGKALGNGMPISAMIAPRDYMKWLTRNDPVFILSSTTNANNACLYAADYVLDNWDQASAHKIWHIGSTLQLGLLSAGWDVVGHAPRFIINWRSDEEHGYFVSRMRDMSVLANRPFFTNLAHTEHNVAETVLAAKQIRNEITEMGPQELVNCMRDKLPQVLFKSR